MPGGQDDGGVPLSPPYRLRLSSAAPRLRHRSVRRLFGKKHGADDVGGTRRFCKGSSTPCPSHRSCPRRAPHAAAAVPRKWATAEDLTRAAKEATSLEGRTARRKRRRERDRARRAGKFSSPLDFSLSPWIGEEWAWKSMSLWTSKRASDLDQGLFPRGFSTVDWAGIPAVACAGHPTPNGAKGKTCGRFFHFFSAAGSPR